MHNLHIVTLEADSREDAIEKVVDEISGFGNEDNYFKIAGTIDRKKGKFKKSDKNARFQWYDSEEKINSFLKTSLKNIYDISNIDINNTQNKMESWIVFMHYRHKYHIFGNEDITLWDGGELYSYKFNEVGLTRFDDEKYCNFAVLIDMHS